jgi:hypothetical protein
MEPMNPRAVNELRLAVIIDRPAQKVSDKLVTVWARHEPDGVPAYYRLALVGRYMSLSDTLSVGTEWIVCGKLSTHMHTKDDGTKVKVMEIVLTGRPMRLVC